MEVMAIHKQGVNTDRQEKPEPQKNCVENIQDSISEEESLIEEEEPSIKTEDIISAQVDPKSGQMIEDENLEETRISS